MPINVKNLQTVKAGLEIKFGTGTVQIYAESFDPSVDGLWGNIGSLYLRTSGSLYKKTGLADTDWSDISSGGNSSENISFTVFQENHGFNILQPVYFNLSNWVLANSISESSCATHVVVEITNQNEFILGQVGMFNIPNTLDNGIYYVSDVFSGEVVITTPEISNPVYIINGDNVYLLNYRPLSPNASTITFSIDSGGPDTIYLTSQMIEGGNPSTIYTQSQIIDFNKE
jgi:hypothetical protein